MRDVLLFAALGLGAGALIASIALGVVLIYRGSGVINVATGAIAMLAAYIFWALRTGLPRLPALDRPGVRRDAGVHGRVRRPDRADHLPTPPQHGSAREACCVTRSAAGAGVGDDRHLRQQPEVGAVGASLRHRLTIFDRVVPVDRFLLAGIVVVVAAVLAALFRWTPFGLSTRAASENEVSAMLAGLSPSRLAVANTVLASVVAGGLGVLVAPLIALDAQTLAFQVVPALAAALLAGFTSFFIACFAGLAIGVMQSLLVYWGTQSWFPTRRGRSADSRAARALRLPRHRPCVVPARGKPARPRRTGRAATPGRAPPRAAAEADGDRRGRRRRLPDRLSRSTSGSP